MTPEEILYKLAARCSTSEQCSADIENKLSRYDLTEKERTHILRHLIEEKYIDDTRYAQAFVRDKYRFNRWGRIKISQELRMKGIDKETINTAMETIDEKEYTDILRNLIASKRKSIRGASEYEINGKLIRFATSRGFEFSAIRRCIDVNDNAEDYYWD